MVPAFEKPCCNGANLMISAVLVYLETPIHPRPDRNRFLDKDPPIQLLVPEGVPEPKHAADFPEHPFGEFHSIGTPAGMPDSLEISYDVSPTELSQPLVVGFVGTESV